MEDKSAEFSSRPADAFNWVLKNRRKEESTLAGTVDSNPEVRRKQSEKLYRSYLFTGTLDFLNRAVRYAEEVVSMSGPASPYASIFGYNLVRPLLRRFQHSRHSMSGPASPCAPIFGYNLARPLLRRFQRSRRDEDISKAIELLQDAYRALTDDDCMRQKCFGYLSIAYLERDGNLDGFTSELELNAPHSQNRTSTLLSYETVARDICATERDEVFDYFWETFVREYFSVFDQFQGSTLLKALNSGIEIYQYALSFFSSDNAKVGQILVMLGFFSYTKFKSTNKLADVDRAINALSTGLPFVPPSSRCYGRGLLYACEAYMLRYQSQGRSEDCDSSIRFGSQALDVLASEKPMVARCLSFMAVTMSHRYGLSLDKEALDAAIDYMSRVIDIADATTDEEPDPRPDPTNLQLLSTWLADRGFKTHRGEDLSDSIKMGERAIELLDAKSSERTNLLLFIGQVKSFQFEKLRGKPHLEQAWQTIKQIDTTPEPHLDVCRRRDDAIRVVSLAMSWHNFQPKFLGLDRSSLLSAIDKLDSEEAPVLDPESVSLGDFVSSFGGTYVSSSGIACSLLLSVCIDKARRGEPLDQDEIDKGISKARDLLKKVQKAQEALNSAMPELVLQSQEILGHFLYFQYKRTKESADGEAAVAVLNEGFARSLHFKCPQLGIGAGHLAVDILSDLDFGSWDRAHTLSQKISNQVLSLNSRSLGWQDKQYCLRVFGNRTAIDTAIALQAGSDLLDIIRMLEACRGSMLGYLIDNRTDLDELAQLAPEKAQLFTSLQSELNKATDDIVPGRMHSRVTQTTRKAAAEAELNACLNEIRSLEGFHRFLLGPTEGEVRAAAARGPIIIVNVTAIRSDAIIITKDAVTLMPLPGLKYVEVMEMIGEPKWFGGLPKNRQYKILLKWLWVNCVKFIFEKLKDLGYGPTKFHIWWIPIGIASSLPFHAAGIYTKPGTERNSSETALSRAFSSYCPTLRILIHGRGKLKHVPDKFKSADKLKPDLQLSTCTTNSTQKKPRLAIIIMPSTPGETPEDSMDDLKGVQHEAEQVRAVAGDTYTSTTQLLCQPSAKDALACVSNFDIVHFACHGSSCWDDPSMSFLALQVPASSVQTDSEMSPALDKLTIRDVANVNVQPAPRPALDKLTIRDVANVNLRHGKLAFLSACCTAENKDARTMDESLHLAAAFHVAGYLHTVGNLWPSDDEISVHLVRSFYEHLVHAGEFGDGDNVARALNEATIDIAKLYPGQPLCWVQFVHFGI